MKKKNKFQKSLKENQINFQNHKDLKRKKMIKLQIMQKR